MPRLKIGRGSFPLESKLTTDLDAAFAPDAEIHLNHAVIDREKFREFVQSRRSAKTQVECKPEDLIETPVEEGNTEAGSIVAGKATLIKTLPFLIRAAPAKTSTVISLAQKKPEAADRSAVPDVGGYTVQGRAADSASSGPECLVK
ncbi:hypothetical protein B0H13DRAFT_1851643 [Mycena leptocephala]|nr:hypothetical protein B0H13DRAFT_1851643 [Mycena leptocephala]